MQGVTKKLLTQSQFDKRSDTIDKIRIDFYTKKIDHNKMVERFIGIGHTPSAAEHAARVVEMPSRKNQIKWLLEEKHLNVKGEPAYTK